MKIPVDPKIKGLIFDIDGTLADTMPLHYEAWQDVGKKFDFIFPEDFFYEMAGIPTWKLIGIFNEKYGYQLEKEIITREKENAVLEKLKQAKPILPVVEVVWEYFGKLPMSLGTGGKRKFASLVIESIGLKKYFDILVSSEDVENHKPFPDTFLKCARLMKIDPKDCLVFEDGELGLEAAYRAGMQAVDIRKYL